MTAAGVKTTEADSQLAVLERSWKGGRELTKAMFVVARVRSRLLCSHCSEGIRVAAGEISRGLQGTRL